MVELLKLTKVHGFKFHKRQSKFFFCVSFIKEIVQLIREGLIIISKIYNSNSKSHLNFKLYNH
uniref:Uncharacterized protein n=1 Tax=Rhizophora mucronata TaxID=61149 RepID=A0A2P2N657_RHIMU